MDFDNILSIASQNQGLSSVQVSTGKRESEKAQDVIVKGGLRG